MDQPLRGKRLLGVRDVQEGGVDFALAERIEHGERRSGNEQDGNSGIGAERVLQAARESRLDQRPVGAEPQRPAAFARLGRLGEHRAGGCRRQRGEKVAPGNHHPLLRGVRD